MTCAFCGHTDGTHAEGCLGRPTIQQARAERDHAIASADDNADPDWRATAYETVRHLATRRVYFTADDIWDVLPKPREPRALAGVLKQLERDGVIKKSGEWRASRYRHASPIQVWLSLAYPPARSA